MLQATHSIPFAHLLLGGVLALVSYILVSLFVLPLISSDTKWWKTQSWVGLKEQSFSQFRAGLDTIKHTGTFVAEGYEKFSREKRLWVLPQFFKPPIVVLPAHLMQELLSFSDDEVDPHKLNAESIADKWTIGSDIADGPHIDVVRRQLTRKLPLMTSDVYEELVLSMKQQWNAKPYEWTTVKAYPTCIRIVSRAANRVFAGAKLCRTPEFIENSREYAVSAFKAAALFNIVPKVLHPVVAPILTRPMKRHLALASKHALPIVRERLELMRNPPKDPNYTKPVDALQWTVEDCIKLSENDPSQLDETLFCRRLLLLNMVAIHTTSLVMTNTLLDLFSSPNRDDFIAGLREEVERVLRESGGEFSKTAINSMYRIDSTIRETMRYSALGYLGMRREIVNPAGIDLSGNIHLPKGVRVATPNVSIHKDPEFYGETANSYDAFRFSRPREAYLAQVKEAGADPDRLARVLEQKNQGLTATAPEFLAFGHGRHSCPGRFFASQEMKLMLAHIVMNYEIEIDGGRPKNMSFGAASVPSDKAEMKVRLRSTAA